MHPYARRERGFTLIEAMFVVVIAAIIAAIAYPAYQNHIVRTRRAAAGGCLQEVGLQMERTYTTSMSYDATALPTLACLNDLGAYYNFQFATGQPTATTYTVLAVPSGVQTRDEGCATLSLTHLGVRGVSGSSPVESCWR